MNTKIFQIGFNKCGTLSIHNFLIENGIPSVHYMKGELANTIFENHGNGVDLLKGLDEYDAFSDMESLTPEGFQYVADDLFKALHRSYPDAVFILNTRPVDDWINSRLRHGGGTYLDRFRCILDKPKEGVIDFWVAQYHAHIQNVFTYFTDYPNANFIHLDLATCKSDELGVFLKRVGFEIKVVDLPHSHRTLGRKKSPKKDHLNALLDAAWYFQKNDDSVSKALFLNALKIEPTNVYAKYMLMKKKQSLLRQMGIRIKYIFGNNQ